MADEREKRIRDYAVEFIEANTEWEFAELPDSVQKNLLDASRAYLDRYVEES